MTTANKPSLPPQLAPVPRHGVVDQARSYAAGGVNPSIINPWLPPFADDAEGASPSIINPWLPPFADDAEGASPSIIMIVLPPFADDSSN